MEETETPQPLPYFTATTEITTVFKLRQQTILSSAAGEDVRLKVIELFPKASVVYDTLQVIIRLPVPTQDLAQAKEIFDKLYSAMFMRVNYGKDGAVLESLLAAHPELRAVQDLGQLLVSFNSLLLTVGTITTGLAAAEAAAVLSDKQLDTLQVDRYGNPAVQAAENADGSMRSVTPEQASAAASTAANRLRSANT